MASKLGEDPIEFRIKNMLKEGDYHDIYFRISTVLQIQVYPKNNAPRVSKPPKVAKSDFLLILKIFLTLDDIRPSN